MPILRGRAVVFRGWIISNFSRKRYVGIRHRGLMIHPPASTCRLMAPVWNPADQLTRACRATEWTGARRVSEGWGNGEERRASIYLPLGDRRRAGRQVRPRQAGKEGKASRRTGRQPKRGRGVGPAFTRARIGWARVNARRREKRRSHRR